MLKTRHYKRVLKKRKGKKRKNAPPPPNCKKGRHREKIGIKTPCLKPALLCGIKSRGKCVPENRQKPNALPLSKNAAS